jgi:pheromone shutdown protein TraB
VWWGLYLTSNVTGWLSNMAGGAHTAGGHAASAMVGLASSGLLILCCLAAIKMVRTLTRLQVKALEVSTFA